MSLSMPTAILGALLGNAVLLAALLYIRGFPGTPRGVGWWALGFTLNAVRLLLYALGMDAAGAAGFFLAESLQVLQAVFLLVGTLVFLGRRVHAAALGAAAAAAVGWAAVGAFGDLGFVARTAPLYGLTGLAMVCAGTLLFRIREPGGHAGYRLAAVALILWGVHKWNFPWLRPVEWFAPWGFFIAEALAMTVAVGLVVMTLRSLQLRVEDEVERRRAAEDALRDSEQRLELAFRGANDGLWDWNPDTGEAFFSPRWKEIIGYADDEIGTSLDEWRDRLHPDDRRRVLEALEAFLAGSEERIEKEFRLRHKDGHYVYILSRGVALRDRDGKARRVVGTHQDISALRRVEEGLRESEEMIRTIAETALDGIIVLDPESRIRFWNSAATRIFGYTDDEVMGRRVHDLLTPEEMREAAEAGWAEFRETGEGNVLGRVLQLEAMTRDGNRIPVDLSVSATRGRDGWHAVGIVRDASHRIDSERRQRLTERMEALGNLAGGVAHDLNNMLLPIISLSGMIRDGLPEDSRDRRRLDKVLQAAERAKGLVEEILAFSRHEEPRMVSLDLAEVVGRIIDILRHTIPSTITIETRLADDLPPVVGDPAQIETLVMNLATNGAQAIGAGIGRMTIDLEAVEAAAPIPATTGDLPPGRYARLTVADDGCGIAPEVQARMFDPFFTTKEVGAGTGLGLAVVFGIVRAHGGSIDVDSSPGRGSTFAIYLPAAGEAARAPEE